MASNLAQAIAFVVAAIIVIATGFRLSGAGKPYGSLLLNVHKLVDLAGVIAIGVIVYRAGGDGGFSVGAWGVIVIAALLTIAMFASGGVLSAMERAPDWASWLHKYTPLVAVGIGMLLVLLVLTGIIAEPETVIENLIRGMH